MPRAFLSYSSKDSDYVRNVAMKLKRFQISYDEYCFEVGIDFRESIQAAMSICSVFVLFVSHESLLSGWVNYEIDESQYRDIKGEKKTFLIFILDNTEYTALPKWMQKIKVLKKPNISITAQIIQEYLIKNIGITNERCIGRDIDIKDMSSDLTQQMMNFPNVIAIAGLEGVGRRTFIKEFSKIYLNLNYSVQLSLDSYQNSDDLYRNMCSESMTGSSTSEIAKAFSAFSLSSEEEKVEEMCRLLASFTKDQSFPMIIDNGSMLDSNGHYNKEYMEIFKYFSANYPDKYIIVIHQRHPIMNYGDRKYIYVRRINPLGKKETLALFFTLLKANNISITNQSDVEEISDYLDGYPPAVEYATALCRQYSIDAICQNKKLLMDFKTRVFSQYIRLMNLTNREQAFLKILYNIEFGTIRILSAILDDTQDNISDMLQKFMDYNIVIYDSGVYKISSPIKITINTEYGLLTKAECASMAKSIKNKS